MLKNKILAFGFEATPVLLGVGYIIGPRIAGVMLAGAGLGWWVLIPIIHYFGSFATEAIAPGTIPVEPILRRTRNQASSDPVSLINER